MSRRPVALLASLAMIASSACARHRDPEPVVAPAPSADPVPVSSVMATSRDSSAVHEYRGFFSGGFEKSWFEPCDAPRDDALWWVTLTEDARLQRDSLLKLLPLNSTAALAVRWRATVSPRMQGGAGHMGRGTRYMLVTKIIAVGNDAVEACSPGSRFGMFVAPVKGETDSL